MEPVKPGRRALFAECYPPTSTDTVPALQVTQVVEELNESGIHVDVVKHPSWEFLRNRVLQLKPDVVYCTGGFSPFHDLLLAQHSPLSFAEQNIDTSSTTLGHQLLLAQIFQKCDLETLYIDAPIDSKQVEALRSFSCCRNLIFWPTDVQMVSAAAAQFAHCFFAAMRNPGVCFSEIFALASRSVQLYSDGLLKERPQAQLLPNHISRTEPELPQCSSVPLEPIPDIHFLEDDIPDIDGWENVLLLAPKAEVRLLVCGGPSTIDASHLSLLGEALRALLLTEMRSLTLFNITAFDHLPPNIAEDCTAVRCHIRCASGIEAVVVLGGPPSILSNRLLVQHALRQTLAVDSLCLQFRLPPPSFPPTTARSSADVAGGTPVVDALVVTSVWALHILLGLCQDQSYRGLVSLGIAGVGGRAVTHFQPADTLRYNILVTGMQNQPLVPKNSHVQGYYSDVQPAPFAKPTTERYSTGGQNHNDLDLIESLDNDSDYDIEMDAEFDVSPRRSQDQSLIQQPNFTPVDYTSTRPPLSRCTEAEFYDDLASYLEAHHGKPLDREKFPEAVLNGAQLDLFNLYKEVVSRGGFQVGNGINWKGQVFPKMRNWTANHRMTGVGNALKRHYQAYLRDYEQVHPKDLTGDGCWICGSNDESGTDWICCDHCERWIHFACDRRPFLGTFKDYATGDGGRTYHCPRCSDALKHS